MLGTFEIWFTDPASSDDYSFPLKNLDALN